LNCRYVAYAYRQRIFC